MLSGCTYASYLVHSMYSTVILYINGFKFHFSSVRGASDFGNMNADGKPLKMSSWSVIMMVCGSYRQCLSRASLGNSNHVMATEGHRKALSLDRCGLLKVLLQQDVHHVLWQSRAECSTFQLTLDADGNCCLIMYSSLVDNLDLFTLTGKLCLVKRCDGLWTATASDCYFLLLTKLLHFILTHVLDVRMLRVEVLLKFRELVEVPSLFAEAVTWIAKLHRWGSAATAHGAKPWSDENKLGSTLPPALDIWFHMSM